MMVSSALIREMENQIIVGLQLRIKTHLQSVIVIRMLILDGLKEMDVHNFHYNSQNTVEKLSPTENTNET